MPEKGSNISRLDFIRRNIFDESRKTPIETLQQTVEQTDRLLASYAQQSALIARGKISSKDLVGVLFKGFFFYDVENNTVNKEPTSLEALGVSTPDAIGELVSKQHLTGFAVEVVDADGLPAYVAATIYDHTVLDPTKVLYQLTGVFNRQGFLQDVDIEVPAERKPHPWSSGGIKTTRESLLQGVLKKVNRKLEKVPKKKS